MEEVPVQLEDDHDIDHDTQALDEDDHDIYHDTQASVRPLEPQSQSEGDRPDASTSNVRGIDQNLPTRPSSSAKHQF